MQVGRDVLVDFPQRSKLTKNCMLATGEFYVLQICYSVKLVFKKGQLGRGGGLLREAPEAYDHAVGLHHFVCKAGYQLYKCVDLGS